MSKAYELIIDSLNEIVTDIEQNDGKNLIRSQVNSDKFPVKVEEKIKSFRPVKSVSDNRIIAVNA